MRGIVGSFIALLIVVSASVPKGRPEELTHPGGGQRTK